MPRARSEARLTPDVSQVTSRPPRRGYTFAMHWFDRYRELYRQWWEQEATKLDEEEMLSTFREERVSDELRPLSPDAISELAREFQGMSAEALEFLRTVGAGMFRYPDQEGDFEPARFDVFELSEAVARCESIREQAAIELEDLGDSMGCQIHGSDKDACRAVLAGVRDRPRRFYPLFGPDDVYDFVYVDEVGSVARWYHDYPVCELLDGSYVFRDLDAYGEELIRMVRDGDGYPL